VKGKVLISQPFMMDENFRRTVILIAEHDDEGTIGFVLTRPVDIEIQGLISAFPKLKTRVGYGGPVGQDSVHYVHKLGDELKESLPITDGLWWSGDFDQLISMVDLGKVKTSDILFFIGYSGWSPGQLDEEIKAGSWIVSSVTVKEVLNDDPKEMWKSSLKPINSNFKVISEMPDSDLYN